MKILLLGSGESGKSTFIKQMVIIHGRGEFTADEVRAYRHQIYQNVISAMRVLLDARQKLGFSWQKSSRQEYVDQIMRYACTFCIERVAFNKKWACEDEMSTWAYELGLVLRLRGLFF